MVRILLLALLVVVTTGFYLNSFPGAFHYDDFPLLLENPLVTGESFPLSAFGLHHWGRPLTLWTYQIEFHFFGADPFFFHLTNFSLHLIVLLLLYHVVRRFAGGEYLAFSVVLIFAVHPLQSQAVNYVWSRSVLLMSLFVFLALLVFRRFPVAGLIIAQLAIWSRAEGVLLGLPLILLMPRWWKAVTVLVGVNLLILAVALWTDSGVGVAWNHVDPLSYWMAAPVVLWKYLALMFWPMNLTIDHPSVKPALPLALAALFGFACLVCVLVKFGARYPLLVLGVGWILLALAPSLLLPNPDQINESRSYLAGAGFALLVALGLKSAGFWVGRNLRHGVAVMGIGEETRTFWQGQLLTGFLLASLVLGFGSVTLLRNELWQDEIRLWKEAAVGSPTSVRPRYNLGVALVRNGELERAQEAFEKALGLAPSDDMSYAALGYCAEMRGDFTKAMRLYRAALDLNVENAYALSRLMEVGQGLPRSVAAGWEGT